MNLIDIPPSFSAAMLNPAAWALVTKGFPSRRDAETALMGAERAAALTRREDAAVLDTSSRAPYEPGNVAQAAKAGRK